MTLVFQRPMRRRVPAALALALLLPAPGALGATDARRSLGASQSLLLADGSRFAVYKAHPTKLTVVDAARKKRFRISVEPECSPGDVARALLLLGCRSPATGALRLHVVDLRSRAATQVPERTDQPDRGFDPATEGFGEVGRRWLAGASAESGRVVRIYIDWRTGEKRTFGEESAYTPRDLDSAGLEPVAPRRHEDFAFVFDAPFSATPTRRTAQGAPADLTLFSGGTAGRLGTRVARIDGCSNSCGSISIGAGIVSWASGRSARAYLIRARRRLSWRFDRRLVPAGSNGQFVQHTRDAVYVSVFDASTSTYRLSAIPL